MGKRVLRVFSILALLGAFTGPWVGAVDEVDGLRFDAPGTTVWDPVSGVDFYNLYRGSLSLLAAGHPAQCHGHAIPAATFETPAEPEQDEGFFYLVTAESSLGR